MSSKIVIDKNFSSEKKETKSTFTPTVKIKTKKENIKSIKPLKKVE